MIDIMAILEMIGHIVVTIIAVFIGFGVLIFVHELGHFLAAKKVGIRVEAFAMGFGPKIFGKTIGETEYRINWIPFGGYVKLAGMEGKDGIAAHEVKGGFFAARPGRRSIVVFAGAFFNLLFAFLIFTLLWKTGVYIPAEGLSTTIGAFEEGLPGEKSGLKTGDKILSINDKKITEWTDIMMAVAFANTDKLSIKVLRNGEEKVIKLVSQEDKEAGAHRIGVLPASKVIVEAVMKGTVAEKMGIKNNDEIVAIAEEKVYSLTGFKDELKKHKGEDVTITVVRDGKEIPLTVVVPNPPNDEEYPILGFQVEAYQLVKVYRGPVYSIKRTFYMVYKTLKGLLAAGSQTRVKPSGLTGPLGIIYVIRLSLLISLSYYAWFIAFISFNLGIVNLLPIPVLDGGHLLFAGIEAVRRKPLNEKIMVALTNVFATLIIAFALYITFHDFKRIFLKPEKNSENKKKTEEIRQNTGTTAPENTGTEKKNPAPLPEPAE